MNTRPDEKLRAPEHIAYALGSGGINVFTVLFSTYLLVYYTNVVGINAGLAASVIGASKILDGFSDLLMGYIVDHTNTKAGKSRPWLIRMLIPMAISAVLVFFVPAGWGTTAQVIYMFVTYNLASTGCFTAISVALTSLNGFMTTNQSSRGLNGGLQMIFNAITTVIISNLILVLARAFGQGETYSQRGWVMAVIVFDCVFAVCAMICYFFTTERANGLGNNDPSGQEPEAETERKVSAGMALKALFTNKYWLLALIAGMSINFIMGSSGNSTVYFAQYVLRNVDMQGRMTGLMNLAMVPAAILSIGLMMKFGKRNMMISGMVVNFIGCLMPLASMAEGFIILASVVKGIGFGLAARCIGGDRADQYAFLRS